MLKTLIRKIKHIPILIIIKLKLKRINKFNELIEENVILSLPKRKIVGMLSLEEFLKVKFPQNKSCQLPLSKDGSL